MLTITYDDDNIICANKSTTSMVIVTQQWKGRNSSDSYEIKNKLTLCGCES